MSDIKIGSLAVQNLLLGTTQIDALYIGTEQLWEKTPTTATLTIIPMPRDATVVLTATGYTQEGNSITVAPGTSVHYVVSKEEFKTVSGDIVVNTTIDLPVNLDSTKATLTIIPNPIDATVTLIATGSTQVGNSITVEKGTTVHYVVSKTGYDTVEDDEIVNSTYVLPVSLIESEKVVTIIPETEDGTVAHVKMVAIGYGVVEGDGSASMAVAKGTRIDYTLTADGYDTQTGIIYGDYTKTVHIPMSRAGDTTLTIIPTPKEATTIFTVNGVEVKRGTGTQSYSVPQGTDITYRVYYDDGQGGGDDFIYTVTMNISHVYEIDVSRPHYTVTVLNWADQDTHVDIQNAMFEVVTNDKTIISGPELYVDQLIARVPVGETGRCWLHTVDFSYTTLSDVSRPMSISTNSRINALATINYTPTNATVIVNDGQGHILPAVESTPGMVKVYQPWFNGVSNKIVIDVSAPGYQPKSETHITTYRQAYTTTINLQPEA